MSATSSRRWPSLMSLRARSIRCWDSFGSGPGLTPCARVAVISSRVRSIMRPRSVPRQLFLPIATIIFAGYGQG
jgi:hypothetical protein